MLLENIIIFHVSVFRDFKVISLCLIEKSGKNILVIECHNEEIGTLRIHKFSDLH